MFRRPPATWQNQPVSQLSSSAAVVSASTQPANAARGATLGIVLLGLNAYAVALLLPVAHVGLGGALDSALMIAPLAALFGGAALVGRGQRRDLERALLLAVFPATLAIALALRRDLAAQGALDGVGLMAAAASSLAYAAYAARLSARPEHLRVTRVQPLPLAARLDEPAERRWLRRGVLATTACGAFLVAVLAPALGDRSELVERWGEAADEATVLAAVLGASASVLAIAAIVGPALRANRPGHPAPSRRTARLAVAATIAAVAFMFWWLLAHFDAR